MSERITGLPPAFGDGKRWCIEGECAHKQHPYIIANVGGIHVLYGEFSGGGAFPIGHREVNEANAHLIAAAPIMADYIAKRAALGDTEAIQIAMEAGLATKEDSQSRPHGHMGPNEPKAS